MPRNSNGLNFGNINISDKFANPSKYLQNASNAFGSIGERELARNALAENTRRYEEGRALERDRMNLPEKLRQEKSARIAEAMNVPAPTVADRQMENLGSDINKQLLEGTMTQEEAVGLGDTLGANKTYQQMASEGYAPEARDVAMSDMLNAEARMKKAVASGDTDSINLADKLLGQSRTKVKEEEATRQALKTAEQKRINSLYDSMLKTSDASQSKDKAIKNPKSSSVNAGKGKTSSMTAVTEKWKKNLDDGKWLSDIGPNEVAGEVARLGKAGLSSAQIDNVLSGGQDTSGMIFDGTEINADKRDEYYKSVKDQDWFKNLGSKSGTGKSGGYTVAPGNYDEVVARNALIEKERNKSLAGVLGRNTPTTYQDRTTDLLNTLRGSEQTNQVTPGQPNVARKAVVPKAQSIAQINDRNATESDVNKDFINQVQTYQANKKKDDVKSSVDKAIKQGIRAPSKSLLESLGSKSMSKAVRDQIAGEERVKQYNIDKAKREEVLPQAEQTKQIMEALQGQGYKSKSAMEKQLKQLKFSDAQIKKMLNLQ